MRIFFCLLSVFFLMNGLHAKEIAGVQFSDQVTFDGGSQILVLNGAGVRKKYFVSVYAAALYLKNSSDPSEVINMEGPKRVIMHILHSEIPQEKFVKGWNDGFEANLDESEMNSMRGRLDIFNSFFDSMHEGDRVILDFLPAIGTVVTIQNKLKGTIQGVDFYQALLKVWLGGRPVTQGLKDDLLGR